MRQVKIRILGTALATSVLIASAYANSVDFLQGNHPEPNEQNILFNTTMLGHTIVAHTNRSRTLVDDMSMSTVLSGKGGQSDVDAANGGLIFDISLTVPGHDFKDLIINPFKAQRANDIIVEVFLTNGQEVTDHFDNNTHGNNFLTIVATGSALIDKVTITSSGGFQDLKQTRISGIAPVAVVPEPSSLLLLGSGLLGFVPKLCRKKLSGIRKTIDTGPEAS